MSLVCLSPSIHSFTALAFLMTITTQYATLLISCCSNQHTNTHREHHSNTNLTKPLYCIKILLNLKVITYEAALG